jgi:tRNA pseudouridine-54 N-methylase
MSKILAIQKQNDSIYSSIVARKIEFNRTIILENLSEEEIIILLNEENNRLKEINFVQNQVFIFIQQ